MPRYLVTGGAGFIGSHLVDTLVANGHYVRVLDDLSTGKKGNLPADVELVVADVTDPEAVRCGLADMDGCFHLAAIASVERGQREWLRSHSVNLSGTVSIFDRARRVGALSGRPIPVVYASSAAVYGDPRHIPISEDAPTCPISAYGVDKLGCDLHAAVACRIYNMSAVGLGFSMFMDRDKIPTRPIPG